MESNEDFSSVLKTWLNLISEFRVAISQKKNQYDDRSISKCASDINALTLKFQEDPIILDSVLEKAIKDLASTLLDIYETKPIPFDKSRTVCDCLYNIFRVRGLNICSLLPVNIEISRLIFNEVVPAAPTPDFGWTQNSICFIWLSECILLPFDIKALWDCPDTIASLNLIFKWSDDSLSRGGFEADAAAKLIAKISIRHELVEYCHRRTIAQIDKLLLDRHISEKALIGQCLALVEITKHGFLPMVISYHRVLSQTLWKLRQNGLNTRNNSLQHLIIKLYKILCQNLLELDQDMMHFFAKSEENANDRAVEFIEEAIDYMIESLLSEDLSTRNKSAKNLAQIYSYLAADFRSELIISLCNLCGFSPPFTSKNNLIDWSDDLLHGFCTLSAELARRSQVKDADFLIILPVSLQGLRYVQRSGSNKTRIYVKDAACYCLWTMIRYNNISEKAFKSASRQLTNTMLLDKDVNIRRAASAAFQEGVGRHSCCPSGIHIITLANFFTLSQIEQCYLELTPKIHRIDFYRDTIDEYLVNYALLHWDVKIRTLAADCLAKLCVENIQTWNNVLSDLVLFQNSQDLVTRESGLRALARILKAFWIENDNKDRAKVFRDVQGYGHLFHMNIEKFVWKYTAQENIRTLIHALSEFMESYIYVFDSSNFDNELSEMLLRKLLQEMDDNSYDKFRNLFRALQERNSKAEPLESFLNSIGSGSSLMDQLRILKLCSLCPNDYNRSLDIILQKSTLLISHENGHKLPCFYRQKLVQSVVEYIDKINSGTELRPMYLEALADYFALAANDHESTAQGDVGSKIRIEAYVGLTSTIMLIDHSRASNEILNVKKKYYYSKLLKGSIERIDKVRNLAFSCERKLLTTVTDLSCIPPDYDIDFVRNHSEPKFIELFQLSLPLLETSCFFSDIFLELAMILGRKSVSTRFAFDLFCKFLDSRSQNQELVTQVWNGIRHCEEIVIRNPFLINNFLSIISIILENGFLDNCSAKWPSELMDMASIFLRKSNKDVNRKLLLLQVFSNLIVQDDDQVRKKAMKILIRMCSSTNIRIRIAAMEKLAFLAEYYNHDAFLVLEMSNKKKFDLVETMKLFEDKFFDRI